jgi:hypothetical protein
MSGVQMSQTAVNTFSSQAAIFQYYLTGDFSLNIRHLFKDSLQIPKSFIGNNNICHSHPNTMK